MSEPAIYNAADEAMKATTAYLRDYTPPVDRIEERDPVWNFEQIPGALQEQTDLRAWMQKTKDAKLDLVKVWTKQLTRQEGEDLNALQIRRVKVKRRLLYVVATEAMAANGDRDIAAEAFKAVFPKG
jgi:hypothetical protein